MQKEIIIAGFGGQGVLFSGQVVAYAAGPQVVTLPWPNLAGLLDPSLALPAGSR